MHYHLINLLKEGSLYLDTDPLIIDDFAHNPDGIIATIKSAAKDV